MDDVKEQTKRIADMQQLLGQLENLIFQAEKELPRDTDTREAYEVLVQHIMNIRALMMQLLQYSAHLGDIYDIRNQIESIAVRSFALEGKVKEMRNDLASSDAKRG